MSVCFCLSVVSGALTRKEACMWMVEKVSASYLWILGRVDDLALSVHDPIYRDSRNHVGLDELQVIDELRRGSGKLRLLHGRIECLLAPSSLVYEKSGLCASEIIKKKTLHYRSTGYAEIPKSQLLQLYSFAAFFCLSGCFSRTAHNLLNQFP